MAELTLAGAWRPMGDEPTQLELDLHKYEMDLNTNTAYERAAAIVLSQGATRDPFNRPINGTHEYVGSEMRIILTVKDKIPVHVAVFHTGLSPRKVFEVEAQTEEVHAGDVIKTRLVSFKLLHYEMPNRNTDWYSKLGNLSSTLVPSHIRPRFIDEEQNVQDALKLNAMRICAEDGRLYDESEYNDISLKDAPKPQRSKREHNPKQVQHPVRLRSSKTLRALKRRHVLLEAKRWRRQ
jgi:hypothetical protein